MVSPNLGVGLPQINLQKVIHQAYLNHLVLVLSQKPQQATKGREYKRLNQLSSNNKPNSNKLMVEVKESIIHKITPEIK